jgi:hypothetical protein
MTLTLPHTIVGGERENAAHLMNNDLAIRDAINAAAELPEHFYNTVTAMDDSTILTAMGAINHANRSASTSTIVTAPWPATMYIDPEDYEVADFTTSWRMFANIAVGTVNPGMSSFTVSLVPAVLTAGDGLQLPQTAVESLVVPLNTGGMTNITVVGDLFEILVAGTYVLTVTPGSAMPADAVLAIHAGLQVEYV